MMKKLIILFAVIFINYLSFGQHLDLPKCINHEEDVELLKIAKLVYDYGTIYYDDNVAFNVATFYDDYEDAFELSDEDEIILVRQSTSINGNTNYHFQQYHNNIKVSGGRMILHVDTLGNLVSSNGRFVSEIPDFEEDELISEEDALAIALDTINAEQYSWEVLYREEYIQWRNADPTATYYPSANTYYVDVNNEIKMVFEFSISTEIPKNSLRVSIDAETGNVLLVNSDVFDAAAPAETLYSGAQIIETEPNFGGGFKLLDATRGSGIHTMKEVVIKGPGNGFAYEEIVDADDVWNSVFMDQSTDQQGLDAHWATEVFFDYFYNFHGVTTLDGDFINGGGSFFPREMLNIIHRQDAGGMNNASYNYGDHEVKYGDNDGTPLTCPDVVFHEWGHAFMMVHLGRNVNYGESYALHEAIADIVFTWITFFEMGVEPDWVQGNECATNIQVPRNIANPLLSGNPTTYHSFNYENDMEGHRISLIISHWYYLLVNGGDGSTEPTPYALGSNVNGYPYSVTGIGHAKARDILFEAIAERMSGLYPANSQYDAASFADLRNVTIEVVRDFYGSCSLEANSVVDAWYAVGMLPDVTDIFAIGLLLPNIFIQIDELCQPVYNDNTTTINKEAFYKIIAPGEVNCVSNQTEIMSQATVILKSANQIELKPGFHAYAGSSFRAFIGPCVTNQYPKNGSTSTFQPSTYINQKESIETVVKIYPNPSSGRINFLIPEEESKPAKVKIYTLLGQLVYEKNVIFNNGSLILDLSDNLSQQNYMLKIRMYDGTEYNKIIAIE